MGKRMLLELILSFLAIPFLGAMDPEKDDGVKRRSISQTSRSDPRRWSQIFDCGAIFPCIRQRDSYTFSEVPDEAPGLQGNPSEFRSLDQKGRDRSGSVLLHSAPLNNLFEGCKKLEHFWARMDAKRGEQRLSQSEKFRCQEQLGQVLPSRQHYDWLKGHLPKEDSILSLFSGTALWEFMLSLDGWNVLATDVEEHEKSPHTQVVILDPLKALDTNEDRNILWTNQPPEGFPIADLVSQFKGDWWVRIDLLNDTKELSSQLWEPLDQRTDVETCAPHRHATITIYKRLNLHALSSPKD
jgi:hypothetical protein